MAITYPTADPGAFLAALQATDWSAFEPARDLPPLRAALAELERTQGITDAHRLATERIKGLGAVLRHPDGHPAEINGYGLSPCGRYLAIGSWCGDDYEQGGMLQVWELAGARCVNVLDGITGGVGWPGYPRTIQWSADGRRVALAYNTNGVGVWDPFGEEPEPLGEAYVTDGNSRPPGFAFAPDGTRAFIVTGTEREVQGCVAPLAEGEVFWTYGEDDEGDLEVALLSEPLPDTVRALLGDDELFLRDVFWSRDGRRLQGCADGWVCALDADSGRVLWFAEAGTGADAPSWSRDERYFAHQLHGRLLIGDALTGWTVAKLPGHPGASELCWGSYGPVARLAVVVPDGNEANARPHVTIHDQGRHRYDVDVALRLLDPDHDGTAWAWSPDGLHAAALTARGQVEVWSLGDAPSRVGAVEAPADAAGVVWGADGVIAVVGPTCLRFFQAADGRITGDFAFLRTPPEPRPLELDGEDVGEEVRAGEEASADPTFALDDETWAVAFEQGQVIAPPERAHALDGALAWTVERRFGWPVRWGTLDIAPDAATAAERFGPPLREYLEPFRGHTPPADEDWPPPNTVTLEDLFQLALTSVRPLASGWDYHVSRNLRHAARLKARLGDPAGARALLDGIPTPADRVRGGADVATILAAAGRRDEARTFFDGDESRAEAALDEYNVAFVASSVAAAYAAMGDPRADAWFGRARAAIEPETNPGEHRLAVAWALIECGRENEGRALLLDGGTPTVFSSVPLLAYLILTHRDHLAREIIPLRDPAAEEWQAQGWFDGWEAVEVLARLGRPDLLREWAQVYGDGYAYEDQLAQAEANARRDPARPRPSEGELAALIDAYATLRKTPRSQREHPTQQLAVQAAECGHLGAALDLIRRLPADDLNGRAGHAFRAIWITVTGLDVEPW
ncbi:WD40 repeat domain-containing protein [[Actinomadura] parvosata]|uniref:WD40 repeat domain-containing protein n=1 Tax=[Actinomadura] parvosata TaxID=1955412 RepID=UPI00406C1198